MKTVLTLCLIGCCFFSTAQTFNFMHNSVSRNYIVHLPPSYSPANSYPLVINMHGYGSDAGQQQLYAEMDAVADTADFIVVYPDGINNSWNSGQTWSYEPGINDVTFISALIDTMSMNYSINANMVYACGMSNGGYMSYRLACELEDKIAAIASVTGVMADSVYSSCQTDRPVPILHMHGTIDPTVAYNGSPGNTGVETGIDWWVANNNCPTPAVITNIPDINTTDASTVEQYYYGPCDDGSEVILFKITGGEHTWPGVSFTFIGVTNQDIDGSGEAWTFFRRHPMNSTPPVGTEEIKRVRKIQIWPNPSSGTVHIAGIEDGGVITVVNMLGQSVRNLEQVNEGMGKVSLDISTLQNGVYLVKVTDTDRSVTQLLVKQ